jgi:hypothetical protein
LAPSIQTASNPEAPIPTLAHSSLLLINNVSVK